MFANIFGKKTVFIGFNGLFLSPDYEHLFGGAV